MRTAKPCGPGRRCYGQALANAAFASTDAVPATFAKVREARRNSAPGRARHKPSDHRAGKAVCWASPVAAVRFSLRTLSRSGPRVPPAPGLPCALLAKRVARSSKARVKSAARMRRRVHEPVGWVERSETHHVPATMMRDGFRFALPILRVRVGRTACRPLLRHCEERLVRRSSKSQGGSVPTTSRIVTEIVGAALCAFAYPTALRPVARTSGSGGGDSLRVHPAIAAKLGALRVS